MVKIGLFSWWIKLKKYADLGQAGMYFVGFICQKNTPNLAEVRNSKNEIEKIRQF